MIIKFKNWEKYQPRKVTGSTSWLRIENNILQNPKMFHFAPIEIYAVLYLLCEASKANKNGEVFVNHEHARNTSRVESRDLNRTIKKLKELQMVEVRTLRGCYAKIHKSDTTNETDETRRDETDENTIAQPPVERVSFDFEKLYSNYPRKQGKHQGLLKAKNQVKTQADYDSLAAAILKYRKHCETSGLQPEFIQHFSTFMSSWRDWLDDDVGTININAGYKSIEQILKESGEV